MRKALAACVLLTGVLAVGFPASAHHGNAAFSDKVTEFKNVTVTKFAWANPHCLVEFDAKDANGKVVNWSAESGSPEALRLTGWNKNSLRPGDMITIYVHTAKTGAPAGRLTRSCSPMAPSWVIPRGMLSPRPVAAAAATSTRSILAGVGFVRETTSFTDARLKGSIQYGQSC